MKEDYAVILDYLPLGYIRENISTFKKKPIVQAIGTRNFSLLELIPKDNVQLELFETVYIGAGKRDKINRVKGKLDSQNLTKSSRLFLDEVIELLILANEKEYVQFFNSYPFPLRHLREVGKKYGIISNEIKKSPFTSFNDIKIRVSFLSNPIRIIKNRVKYELGIEKNYNKKKKSAENKELFLFTKQAIPKINSKNGKNRNKKGKKNIQHNNKFIKENVKKTAPTIHKNLNVNCINIIGRKTNINRSNNNINKPKNKISKLNKNNNNPNKSSNKLFQKNKPTKKIINQNTTSKQKNNLKNTKTYTEALSDFLKNDVRSNKEIELIDNVSICEGRKKESKSEKRCRLCGGRMKKNVSGYKCENAPKCTGAISGWSPF